ncbi:MAG: XdhC family protein [Rhodospirillales bacterium]|nr:XdhC family protein [Rhodospirillales bacterium]
MPNKSEITNAGQNAGSRAHVLKQAQNWLEGGDGVALATVVGTWGSSPRPEGSLLAVSGTGAFVGSVSGGCIEGAVVKEALEVIAEGKPRLLDYGITDEQAWEVGLACGGEMKVFVEKFDNADLLNELLQDRPLALITDFIKGSRAIVRPEGHATTPGFDPGIANEVRQVLQLGISRSLESPDGPLFVNVFNPPLRMIIIGAVHTAQSLAPLANLAGFKVTIVDPRRAFGTDERFAGITLNGDWPDDAMAELAPDSNTAVVALTHDPKLDDPALEAALRSDAYYLGALGSRRNHAKRLDRLRQRGFGEDDLNRIHGPIGLDLGGRSTSDIAVSILAEAIAVRHGKTPKI